MLETTQNTDPVIPTGNTDPVIPTGNESKEGLAPSSTGEPVVATQGTVLPAESSGAASGEDGGAQASPIAEQTPSSEPAKTPVTPKAKDWRDARIAQLTAKLKEAQGQAKSEVQGAETPVPVVAQMPEFEIERRARELSAQQSQINAFNSACQAVADQGKVSFGDFDARINELKQLAGDGDLQQQMMYNSFIAAAIETGEAPRLLHELGGNLNEAARIMALPPFKMAVELTKLSMTRPGGEASRAPKPITPIGGQRASHSAIDPTDPDRADNLTTAEWMKRRETQASEARKRG